MQRVSWKMGFCIAVLTAGSALAQQPAGPPPPAPPSHREIAPGMYVVTFDHRNSLVTTGPEGVMVVETQLPETVKAFHDYVKTFAPGPVRYAIATHWHSDHAGGGAYFRSQGAVTIADDISRKRLSQRQVSKFSGRAQEALEPAGLPMITYATKLTVHFNGDEVELQHWPEAHTDGDATVFLKKANIIHMGDLFVTTMYTNVRNVDAFVKALDGVLAMIDDNTKVIPWHGEVSDKKKLAAWRHVLATVGGRVKKMMAEGKSEEEIVAAKPFEEFNAAWGGGGRADMIVKMIVAGEKGEPD